MADWEEPATDQVYTDHFGSIRDKDTSLVKMLDGTSDTNLPTGAKRKNSGQKYRLEEWDGASWNMVEPGLGSLTQAEVDQLATIGTTTINATQWGYLGGLGSAPLEDDDLAANGGTVPETNRSVEIIGTWTFGVQTRNNSDLNTHGDNFRVDTTTKSGSLNAYGVYRDGAFAGGISVQGHVYDNNNRVYSASNAPASTNLSDHESQVVELGGDFDAGEEVRCERIGNWVTITATGQTTHSATTFISASSNVIPSNFRPSSDLSNMYSATNDTISEVTVFTNGDFSIRHFNWDGTYNGTKTNAGVMDITYLIT